MNMIDTSNNRKRNASIGHDGIREYLESTRWDYQLRHASFARCLLGAGEPIDLRPFFVDCVRRIFAPGCKVDRTLVLVGPSGCGKSSALATLFGHDRVGERLTHCYHSSWCSELSDLSFHRGADIKPFLAASSDVYRRPYDTRASERSRSFVCVGTANEFDPGHSRRFSVVRCGSINVDRIATERDQVWAEAVAAYWLGAFGRWE